MSSSPTPYSPAYNFTGFQAAAPATPLPADMLDAELALIASRVNAGLSRLAEIQRSDGPLKNASVHPDALDAATLLLLSSGSWAARGAWITATAYVVGDLVTDSGTVYVCIVAHTSGTLATDVAASKWMTITSSAAPPSVSFTGAIRGLTISNNSGAPNTDLDLAAGECVDSTGAVVLALAVGTTKRVQSSGAWSAGNAGNALFSGARANSTWYYVHLIRKTSDGTIDWGVSTSVTAAGIPSGYSGYRRLGAVKTDGSGNLLLFKQIGDEFEWDTWAPDLASTAAVVGSWTDLTLTVPPIDGIIAEGTLQVGNGAPSKGASVTFRRKGATTPAPALDQGVFDIGDEEGDSATRGAGPWKCFCSALGVIQYYALPNAGNPDCALYVRTKRWIDRRLI